MDINSLKQEALNEFNKEKQEDIIESFKATAQHFFRQISSNNQKIEELQQVNERIREDLKALELNQIKPLEL